jgi:hypothetical protein
VWCPDASKVATAFDTDVAIYDAGGKTPTQGRIALGDQLITASVAYEEKIGGRKTETNANAKPPAPASASSPTVPASFNPIIRLEWPSPETLYFKTAYVLVRPSETINTIQRWHLLNLSAQAAFLSYPLGCLSHKEAQKAQISFFCFNSQVLLCFLCFFVAQA